MRHIISLLILIAIPSITTAETISEYDGGSVAFAGDYGYGQSVLTPSGGPWTNITFGFLSIQGGGYTQDQYPQNAVGQLFVFTQEYTGLFSAPYQGAPGFLATGNTPSTASNHRFYAYWEFDSSLVLSPNTRYYFYASQRLLGVGISDPSFPYLDEEPTNQGYLALGGAQPAQCGGANSSNCTFIPLQSPGFPTTSFNYVLTGVVPEPQTYAMLLAGLGLLSYVARRRKQKVL